MNKHREQPVAAPRRSVYKSPGSPGYIKWVTGTCELQLRWNVAGCASVCTPILGDFHSQEPYVTCRVSIYSIRTPVLNRLTADLSPHRGCTGDRILQYEPWEARTTCLVLTADMTGAIAGQLIYSS